MKLSGWAKYPEIDSKVSTPYKTEDIIKLVKKGNVIARGNGRSYGDSAISLENTIHMKNFNKIISFDSKTGQLIAESGVLLKDILKISIPKGWFPFVTPGSKFVTIGGMIAADVHGKNHHKEGSFSNYVDWIEIIDNQGTKRRCSSTENPDLFTWTNGGMGLTGIILCAAIRLRPITTGWIKQKTLIAKNIDEAIDIFENSLDSTYSVGWIDCLQKGKNIGRSVIMLGEHANKNDMPEKKLGSIFEIPIKKKRTMLVNFPNWFLNKWSNKLFNNLYYWYNKRQPRDKLIDWDSFFYPLDSILGWNKIYGRKGFAQFQCVIPQNESRKGLRALLEKIESENLGSFLAVIKRFGEQESKFSFPMKGYTLALDFPINDKALKLMNDLDIITLKYNGRFYLAKDSRMSKETFYKSDKRSEIFRLFRKKQNTDNIFNSAQSTRLGL